MQHTATYSPQDNKIRLYFAFRLPRDEWDALRNAGFTWTMKQKEAGGCDMVAPWTPEREDIALDLAGEIDDEDQPREERAAQRAERFEAYQNKREGEALGHAHTYETTPSVHGHQNERRAERAAERHDRQASRAVSQWSKADYWQRRTDSVIRHALYVERPDVRHRRIKGLEADLRRLMANVEPSKVVVGVEAVRQYCGEEYVQKGHDHVGIFGQGRGRYARSYKGPGLEFGPTGQRWKDHYEMRIAYEKQMLAAQGGTSADVEVVPGGFYGKHQVQKISKDKAGRISKIWFRKDDQLIYLDAESEALDPQKYRPPTPEEAAAFANAEKDGKAGAKKQVPLLNPTRESAQVLIDKWTAGTKAREAHDKERGQYYCSANYNYPKIIEMTSEEWTRYSRHCEVKTAEYDAEGTRVRDGQKPVFRLRIRWTISSTHIVVLTDKPQVALPLSVPNDAAELIRSCQALLEQVAQ